MILDTTATRSSKFFASIMLLSNQYVTVLENLIIRSAFGDSISLSFFVQATPTSSDALIDLESKKQRKAAEQIKLIKIQSTLTNSKLCNSNFAGSNFC